MKLAVQYESGLSEVLESVITKTTGYKFGNELTVCITLVRI
jgi:hypothetical protein